MRTIKFECNCDNQMEFETMLNTVHNAITGFNFEVGARLWYTLDGLNKAIMVEYQMTTKDCRELVENDNEPDWFVAYEVKDEDDYDCSKEIFIEAAEENIIFAELENAMLDFAKFVCEKFYK